MADALKKIVAYKRAEVVALKKERSFECLHSDTLTQSAPRGFRSALTAKVEVGQNALICELKRKSPSAGDILVGADPEKIAKEYETGGAACLSVLTDYPSFGGSLSDFKTIRNAVDIPMLRKDFMIDPIQIVESRASGADCVLVILSALSDALAAELIATAHEYQMDVLVETHDASEVHRANALEAALIGINNRDLKRMVTTLDTTERLAPLVAQKADMVSESGIRTAQDIERLNKAGANRFLIGESLMKQADKQAAVAKLVAGTP